MYFNEKEMKVLVKIKRKIHNLSHPELGVVLMLHRVVDSRSRIAANRDLEITADFLEHTILEYRQKGYIFVNLDEVVDIIEKGNTKHKFVCFTFDDGYRDNYEIAYPIFKKYNIPFTIYVTTDFYEQKALLWWYVLEDLCVTDEEFLAYREKIFNLKTDQIESAFKEWFPGRNYSFADAVNKMALTVAQIRELSDSGLCCIGSHTVTHPRLDKLTQEEQRYEISTSKNKLEAVVGKQVEHFAFPYGCYNSDTIPIVAECGYKTAVRAYGGIVRKGAELLQINRVFLKQ